MILNNIKSVMREVDAYKIELKGDIKLTRDEMASAALVIMKKTLSQRQSFTGRGANKKFIATASGAPPAKKSGTLFRSIKSRKWNKEDRYGAYVGLPKRGKNGGYGSAYYGVILESSNRAANGNAFRSKKSGTGVGGKGKGAYPQRAPGIHKWAKPSMERFQPIAKEIINKNLGRTK